MPTYCENIEYIVDQSYEQRKKGEIPAGDPVGYQNINGVVAPGYEQEDDAWHRQRQWNKMEDVQPARGI